MFRQRCNFDILLQVKSSFLFLKRHKAWISIIECSIQRTICVRQLIICCFMLVLRNFKWVFNTLILTISKCLSSFYLLFILWFNRMSIVILFYICPIQLLWLCWNSQRYLIVLFIIIRRFRINYFILFSKIACLVQYFIIIYLLRDCKHWLMVSK